MRGVTKRYCLLKLKFQAIGVADSIASSITANGLANTCSIAVVNLYTISVGQERKRFTEQGHQYVISQRKARKRMSKALTKAK